ncbi:MAG: OmpA family protein, partial [Muribaculaceae bacterium]|nr:OmpA family protein [Muribaculaceae bacterium]
EALHRIRGLKSIVESASHYKVLVAVHADDTGDDAYSDALTEARANAVDDLLWQLAGRDDTNVVIYGLGKDEPLNDNTTRTDRRANRRIEFYIVPVF